MSKAKNPRSAVLELGKNHEGVLGRSSLPRLGSDQRGDEASGAARWVELFCVLAVKGQQPKMVGSGVGVKGRWMLSGQGRSRRSRGGAGKQRLQQELGVVHGDAGGARSTGVVEAPAPVVRCRVKQRASWLSVLMQKQCRRAELGRGGGWVPCQWRTGNRRAEEARSAPELSSCPWFWTTKM
uniref:Uncharacterized protein n=1 Tax=Aegilops tauschii TaxID=37682 RepID=M8B7F4_AEGTA